MQWSLIIALFSISAGGNASVQKAVSPEPQKQISKMFSITWERYPNLPQGFQDSKGGFLGTKLVTVGGFCQGFDDNKKPGRYPRGFLNKVWALDITKPQGWETLPDYPAEARQGLCGIPVGDSLYCWGGFNYTAPYCYKDGYKLYKKGGKWAWEKLPDLPWSIGAAGTCAIGSRIYVFGGCDYDSEKFTTDTDCKNENERLGARLIVFDTKEPKAGWKRLPDCPGTTRCVAGVASVGGKIYVLGGANMPDDDKYYTVVDNWVFDPINKAWSRLRDLPISSGNFPDGNIVYKDRYLVLVGGCQYAKVRNPDGSRRVSYGKANKVDGKGDYFCDVFVYDTKTDLFGTADPLPINNNMPMVIVRGDDLFVLGGEADAKELYGEYYGHHPDLVLRGKLDELKQAKPEVQAVKPIDIADHVEMFVDDYLIEQMQGMSLKLQTPERREVVMTFDKPWEGTASGYHTIIKDGEKYRLYYRGFCPEDRDPRQVLCYAESSDGINFTRPNLGFVEWDGSKENNIVLMGAFAHNFAPFLDTNPDVKHEERYKAVAGFSSEWGGTGLLGFTSPDGMNWKQVGDKPLTTDGQFDSLNVVFWDPNSKCYRLYSRYWIGSTRAVQSATSKDFRTWSSQQPNVYAPGTPLEHFYTNASTPCPGAEHIYLSFPKRFIEDRKKIAEHPEVGVSDALFMTSRDGINWDRRFLEAWVRPGRDQRNWTERSNMPAMGIVETADDEFSIYISEHCRWNDNRLRRLSIRKHGFASVNADAVGGEFVTRPLIFSGKHLILNYATSAAGSIQVEMLDENGHPIKGYTLQDMPPLYGDELDAVIAWKGGNDLTTLQGKPVRLRFVLKDADLFAMRTE